MVNGAFVSLVVLGLVVVLFVANRLTIVGAPDGVTRFGTDHGLELRAGREQEVEQTLIGRGGVSRRWSCRRGRHVRC